MKSLVAAVLFGTVTDPDGEPLPFANIYIQGTSNGTISNEKGKYEFELEPGTYHVVFNFIGYTKSVQEVTIFDKNVELNVALRPEEIKLKEVVVSASEDPAYAIIRKAIEKRQFHYDQVESYTCKAYTKGLQRIISAPDKIFGQPVNFDGSLDSNNAGIIYLSESISELSFKKPDLVKEKMISSKVSGDSQAFSWNRAGDFYVFNFYQNNIKLEFISDRVFVSPIADNALLHYRYKLLGFYEEDGKLINKIQVIPRRPSDPAFTGIIYIVEGSWNIHSLELYLTKQNQMKFIDTLWVKQVYVPVKENLWMWMSQTFEFNFNILNVKAEGYFSIIYQDYDVNPGLTKKDFSNEILKVEDEANEKDSLYWVSNRPVPLTEEEEHDYARKDSLEELRKSPEYLRSIDKEANKFTPWDLLLGYNYQNSNKKLSVNFMPYIQGLQYNTVEGANLKVRVQIIKELKKKNRSISITPTVRYGFSNKHFNAVLQNRYNYNQKHFAYVALDFGKNVFQFNKSDPISELNNSFHTLFIGRNYMKIFEEAFVKVRHRIEIANGLMLWSNVRYARRFSLKNTSSATVRKEEKTVFTPNITFDQHDAFVMTFRLRWRPGQKYISRPYEKIITGSKYPDLELTYRKAIPDVFKSDRNFDFIQFEISDDVGLGLFGNMHYSVALGTFLNDNTTMLTDLKHFNGNQTVIGGHYLDGFQLLDYYVASTTDNFIEVHFQHNFDGFIFNKIPFIRKSKFQMVFATNFLYTPDYKDYTEIDVGIENILRVFRVDFATSLSKHHPTEFGFRVGIDFGQL